MYYVNRVDSASKKEYGTADQYRQPGPARDRKMEEMVGRLTQLARSLRKKQLEEEIERKQLLIDLDGMFAVDRREAILRKQRVRATLDALAPIYARHPAR